MVLGRRSAKVAPKRVLSAQTRFGASKTSKNVGHVCQSAACVILERKELQRRHLSDLERLDPSGHPKTSDTYAKVRKWIFVTSFLCFKNKKVTKSHFCVLAYVYDVFWCSEGSESQSCVLSALERLGAPKSPKPHFFIRVRRFCVF